MMDLYALWTGIGVEAQAALIGAISTIGVGIIGFGGLILQMRSQGRQARDSVAENERRRLKAAMYEDAVVVCRNLADSAIELTTMLRIMIAQVGFAAQSHSNGQQFALPAARYPQLSERYAKFTDAAFKFIFLVENRQVIDPDILVFRTAMTVAVHDAGRLMNGDFAAKVAFSIPTVLPDGTLYPYTPPSIEHATVIKNVTEALIAPLDDAIMFTEDFLVELQNHLLGDLFGTTVKHRKPLDPSKKVIMLSQAGELEQWFATSTQWGREMARIEAETAARFLPPPVKKQ